MRLDDYDEFNVNKGKSVSIAGVVCILLIVTVLGVVILMNKKPKKPASFVSSTITASVSISDSLPEVSVTQEDKLTVSDLDFYDMYPKDNEKDFETSSSVSVSEDEESGASTETEAESGEVIDETNDGKHTKIILENGTEEWVAINPYLTKNEYDLTSFVNVSGTMEYYVDDKCVSFSGIDISKDNDYIDFVKVAKAGIDFVMIRVGARGYQTGNLTLDEYFRDNIKRARDAGLDVGVYFLSQAVTVDEAVEEADMVIEEIEDYNIAYPVCFAMEYESDFSRTGALTKNERTDIASAFLDEIKSEGYIPMLYASKLWLMKYYELSKLLSLYDVWLSEPQNPLPDFPYMYTMWQYDTKGEVEGIKGFVNKNISLIDYSLK